MRIHLNIWVVFCAASLSLAQAAEPLDLALPHKNLCSHGNMREMNQCLAQEYKNVDATLNSTYKKLSGALYDPSMLKESQLAWVKFRDLECKFKASGVLEESSEYPYTKNACLIDLTLKRIRDLDLVTECLGCPYFK
jgi:uncharacterized protein YecT (DUF1311 family)